jgi:hypothetical protein
MLEIDKHPWGERQQMILDILVNDSVEFDHKKVYNRAIYNKNKFKHYKNEFLKGDFYDKIFNTILET